MREVAERRQQLELEHEQALAILKFKQDEIKRLQRVSLSPAPHALRASAVVGPHLRALSLSGAQALRPLDCDGRLNRANWIWPICIQICDNC